MIGSLARSAGTCATHSGNVDRLTGYALWDAIGVQAHSLYTDTAYGDYQRIIDLIKALGVRHVRDGYMAKRGRPGQAKYPGKLYGDMGDGWLFQNTITWDRIRLGISQGLLYHVGFGKPDEATTSTTGLDNPPEGMPADFLQVPLPFTTGVPVENGNLNPDGILSFEWPNEWDNATPSGYPGGIAAWLAKMNTYAAEFYRLEKLDPIFKDRPVIGPSIVDGHNAPKIGDQTAHLDKGNLHDYFGGLCPWMEALVKHNADKSIVWGSKPVYITEFGYHNALNQTDHGQPSCPEDVAAIYFLKSFLLYWLWGAEFMCVYEFNDQKSNTALSLQERHFGLTRFDYSVKPAYAAIQNFIKALGPLNPPPFYVAPTATATRVQPDFWDNPNTKWHSEYTDILYCLPLQRGDKGYGTWVWRTASSWNRDHVTNDGVNGGSYPNGKTSAVGTVPPHTVTVTLPGSPSSAQLVDPIANTTQPLSLNGNQVQVQVGENPVCVQSS